MKITQFTIAKECEPPQATFITLYITNYGLNLLLFGDSVSLPLPNYP